MAYTIDEALEILNKLKKIENDIKTGNEKKVYTDLMYKRKNDSIEEKRKSSEMQNFLYQLKIDDKHIIDVITETIEGNPAFKPFYIHVEREKYICKINSERMNTSKYLPRYSSVYSYGVTFDFSTHTYKTDENKIKDYIDEYCNKKIKEPTRRMTENEEKLLKKYIDDSSIFQKYKMLKGISKNKYSILVGLRRKKVEYEKIYEHEMKLIENDTDIYNEDLKEQQTVREHKDEIISEINKIYENVRNYMNKIGYTEIRDGYLKS